MSFVSKESCPLTCLILTVGLIIRTIFLPDEIPSAHFCIGGHNPFRVFCNVDIIRLPALFYKMDKIPSVNFQLGQNPSRLKSPTSLQADQSLTWPLGYYFSIFFNSGRRLKLHQQLLGGSNFLH